MSRSRRDARTRWVNGRAPRIVRLLPAAALLALFGCTVGSGEPEGDASTPEDAGLSPHLRFVIEPDAPLLESVNGSMPSVTLRVVAESIEGERFEVTPLSWQLEHDRLGALDAGGTFTASGRAGGTVKAHATIGTTPPREIDTTITVRLDVTIEPDPSIPRERIEEFERLPTVDDPFGAVTLLYPLDGAVLPNNVRPPDLQWHPVGDEGDLFRVVIRTEYATVRTYLRHDGPTFGSRFLIDPPTFRRIADSARPGEVRVHVDRLPAGAEEVIRGEPISFSLTEGGIFGTLYYWQVRTAPESSDVVRLNAATGERWSVFDSAGHGSDCVGCHTVSHDGRRLAATRSGPAGWFTTVVDAASQATPPPTELGPLPAYHALAWNPNGERILASRPVGEDRNDTRLYLLDGSDGRELEASGLPESLAGHPTWSPNGELVAWMEGGGDGPDGTDANTRIVIADVQGDAFTPRLLHDGGALSDAPEGGRTDSHPTFSPDSRFVAFAHGTRSVSSGSSITERSRSALYLIPVEGGEPIRLTRGMGPEGPVDAFWPVFSPFVTQDPDGRVLYWLAFYSRQAYGNEHAGTAGSRRRQLWLTAIDPALAAEGVDPSHPPYWLPGQDVRADDIAAHWAPTACLPQGDECNASSECCSGHCGPDGENGELRCLPPQSCRQAGDSCESADDCCGALVCNLNVCGYTPPD